LDRVLAERLTGAAPALCSESVFLRRIYLDTLGVLPTAAEARAYLQDPDLDGRRQRLVEALLAREEFVTYWAMKWGDLLRIKAEFPVNLWPNAAQRYHRWVRESLAANKPMDVFARELLTSSGSNFRVGPVNFYRALAERSPEGIATAVALTFLGERTEHWPSERRLGLAGFFRQVGYKPTAEWKEEIVFWDPWGVQALPGSTVAGRASLTEVPAAPANPYAPLPPAASDPAPPPAAFPDGTPAHLSPDRDPREVFADWLLRPENPAFARSLANRVWSWLMGRGLVHPADDFRPDNPPSHPELLAFLERELIAAQFDLKHLFRLILNSQAYRLSSLPPAGGATPPPFASYPIRRLEAEVLIDAINGITRTTELYTSPIPEPFTYIPQGQPAVSIGDGSITSPFLALFGRSARSTGQEDERPTGILPAQSLYLLNASHLQGKLERGEGIKGLLKAHPKPAEATEALYLTILSRFPTRAEARLARRHLVGEEAGKPDRAVRAEHWNDLAWALLNSDEFLFRH
jgi:hypothetical protein